MVAVLGKTGATHDDEAVFEAGATLNTKTNRVILSAETQKSLEIVAMKDGQRCVRLRQQRGKQQEGEILSETGRRTTSHCKAQTQRQSGSRTRGDNKRDL